MMMMATKPRTSAAFCDRCDERIIWASTEAGNRQALDVRPSPLGSVYAYQDAAGTWHARAATTGAELRHPLERLYMPHPATCSGPPEIEDPPSTEQDDTHD